MKSILTVLCCSMLALTALAQPSYYRTEDGSVLDSVTYNTIKSEQLGKLQAALPDIVLEEDLVLLYRKPDSTVYGFRWNFVSRPAVDTAQVFKTSDILGKAFDVGLLRTLDGGTVSLAALKGKPTLINLWFTTCKPCIEEMPVLNRIRRSFGDKVNFLAITYEGAAQVQAFLLKHRFDFLHVADAQALTDSLRMKAFPINIFLDREGIVRRVENGIPYERNAQGAFVMGDGKKIEAYLRELLR
jgi:thiol-disulfide isomerase/thioredoxin